MKKQYPIGTPLTFVWRFQTPDGEPLLLTDDTLAFRLRYYSGRGTREIQSFVVSPELDGITWTMQTNEEFFAGRYGLVLDVFSSGRPVCHIHYKDAFALYLPDGDVMSTEQSASDTTIYLLSVGEFYYFIPHDGLSAYEVAVKNGYEGTEQEWLNSLKGGECPADEEDLTIESDVFKFKDRGTDNGLGYIILRQGSDFADQLTQEDTIYEIRYDFDLDNASVEIPAGCVLRFKGGKLSNGTIVGNGAVLETAPVQIFDNVLVTGVNFDYIDIRWFGAKQGEDIADVMDDVMRTYNQNIGTPIKMIGTYSLSRTITCNSGIVIWNDFMVPDLFENRIYAGHAFKPLGRLNVAAGIIAFDCKWTGTLTVNYAPRGTFAFRGIRFVAAAQKDGSDNPTILVRHRISEQPPRGFKVEDCQFENFDKVILCDWTATIQSPGTAYGSVISNFLIDNCTFISDNGYALWAKNTNPAENSGDLTINGLEMVRCTLHKTKLYLVGLYGENNISQIVINGENSVDGSLSLNNPVYIRMKYGTLVLDQWYQEYLKGDFTIVGEAPDPANEEDGFRRNEYDLETVVRAENWFTQHNTYRTDDNYHARLVFKNVSVQAIPDLYPKRNIIFNNASVDPRVLEGRTFGPVDMYSLLPASGANYNEEADIYYASMVVKTEKFSVLSRNAGFAYMNGSGYFQREPIFRGVFSDTGGTLICYSKLNNLLVRNHNASSADYSLSNFVGGDGPFDNDNTFLLTFYKDTNAMLLDFKDANGDVVLTVRTPVAPGVAMVMLKGDLTQIKSLTIRRTVNVDTSVTASYIGIQRLLESPNAVSKFQALSQYLVLINNNLKTAGTTAQRPSAAYLYPGYCYFDSDLGKPIYVSEIVVTETGVTATWVDAAGNAVV